VCEIDKYNSVIGDERSARKEQFMREVHILGTFDFSPSFHFTNITQFQKVRKCKLIVGVFGILVHENASIDVLL
jgi:hypothetical protein